MPWIRGWISTKIISWINSNPGKIVGIAQVLSVNISNSYGVWLEIVPDIRGAQVPQIHTSHVQHMASDVRKRAGCKHNLGSNAILVLYSNVLEPNLVRT